MPNHALNTITKLVRRPDVESATGETRSTIYRKIQKGLFTRPVKLGGGRSGWPAYEVEAINMARIAGKSEADIRGLVTDLHNKRIEP